MGQGAEDLDMQWARETSRPIVAPQQEGGLWSFDDLHIGRMVAGGSSLLTRDVQRPDGVTNGNWYTFAGLIVRLMNDASQPIAA